MHFKKKQKNKQWIAVLLIMAMLLTMMPVTVFAEDEPTDNGSDLDLFGVDSQAATPSAIQFVIDSVLVEGEAGAYMHQMTVGDAVTVSANVVNEGGYVIETITPEVALAEETDCATFAGGELTAVKAGQAVLTASYEDAEESLSATLTVKIAPEEQAPEDAILVDDDITLQEALATAAGSESPVTVILQKDVTGSFTVKSGNYVLDLNGHTVTGANGSVFTLGDSKAEECMVMTIQNGTITGGNAQNNSGGAITANKVKLTLNNIEISENIATENKPAYCAGGVYLKEGEFTVENAVFSGNTANSGNGAGAIFVWNAPVSIKSTQIQDNKFLRIGGFPNNSAGICIYNKDMAYKVELDDVTISGQNGTGTIAALNINAGMGNCMVKNSLINKNNGSHGVVQLTGTQVELDGCTITNNTGSATIYQNCNDLIVKECVITGNTADTFAGGIYCGAKNAELTIRDTVISNNETKYAQDNSTGGVYVGNSTLNFESGAIYDNKAKTNKAKDIYVDATATVNLLPAHEMTDGQMKLKDYVWTELNDVANNENGVPAATHNAPRYYTATEFVQAVYIGGEIADDKNDGLTSQQPVATFEKAKQIMLEQDIQKLLVVGAITVTKEEVWTSESSVKLQRRGSYAGSARGTEQYPLVVVKADGDLTLENVTLDGGMQDGIRAYDTLVSVEANGTLTLKEGAVLQNNEAHYILNEMDKGFEVNKGGAIRTYGTVKIEGGTIQNCSAINGGGIYCGNTGTVVFEHGCIENNYAALKYDDVDFGNPEHKQYCAGGGIYVDKGGLLTMNGGEIRDNHSARHGGGVALGREWENVDTVTSGPAPSNFVMYGGSLRNNTAKMTGGGLYVQCGYQAEIFGGTITENTADYTFFAGGGIYVNGQNAIAENGKPYVNGKLILQNALIANNTADEFGGGIGSCPTSTLNVYVKNGSAIYGNQANEASDVYVFSGFVPGYPGEAQAYVSEYALGNIPYHWLYDNRSLDVDGTEIYVEKLHHTKDLQARTELTEKDFENVMDQVTVRIENNYATNGYGGGIGSNGDVVIGELPNELVDISVTKVWNDTSEEMRPSKVIIWLMRSTGDGSKPEKVATGWVYFNGYTGWDNKIIFDNQPKCDPYGNEYIYTIMEDTASLQGKYVSEVTKGAVTEDVQEWTVTNTPASQLTVSKTVVSNQDGDKEKEFTFTVTLDDKTVNGTYGEMKFTDGVAQFTLHDQESKTAVFKMGTEESGTNELPDGTKYTVVESDNEGFTVTATGATGTLQQETPAVVQFTNTRISGSSGSNPDPTPEPEGPGPSDPPEEEIDEPEVPLAEPELPDEEIIEEPEVPLTDVPGEEVEIEEPEVPLGDAPATGDSSKAVAFVVLLMVAGVGLVVTRKRFN